MATYVLVHGGGHGGWCYQCVARILRSSGHEVYAPTLTGLGERAHLLSKDVDLDLHVRVEVATQVAVQQLQTAVRQLVGQQAAGETDLGVQGQ